jgi:Peptidase propeptide and YPEB domain
MMSAMKTAGIRKFSLFAAALAGLAGAALCPFPAAAEDGDWGGILVPEIGDSQSGPARDEVQNQNNTGPAVSLKEVRRIVRRQYGGQILDTQLFQQGNGWVYRVRVLMDDGRVVDVGVDGQTGQIIGEQG